MKRGEVWYVGFDGGVGHEETVGRPAIIVSSQEGVDTSPVVNVVYTTTQPKHLGLTVELSSMNKRSWALCTNTTSVDKRRLRDRMCTLTDAEMAKVDLALRKAFGLPVEAKVIDDGLSEKLAESEKALELIKDRAAELETDVQVYKRLYDKLLEKYIDLKLDKDVSVTVAVTGEAEQVVVEEVATVEETPLFREPELDLSALKEKFKVYDDRQQQDSCTKVNVNTATAKQIAEATGMSLTVAYSICGTRKRENIRFEKLEDLLLCERFKESHLEKYRDVLEV